MQRIAARGAAMANEKCPRDQHLLDQGTFHDIPALHCPDCDGVLIKQNSLHPLLTEMAKEIAESISPDTPIEALPDHSGGISCPTCYSKMDNYGYMGGKDVMIDCCGQCMELWIDAGELAVMCMINERSSQRLSEVRQAAKEHQRELEQRLNMQEIIRGAYMRGFIMGGIIF
ncbi:MAG: zf-TFIIB domain-containing protein [Thiotrichales bacterium]|nr:zf-TFIIB domain-containing protein [Thiotrichales bacterium]